MNLQEADTPVLWTLIELLHKEEDPLFGHCDVAQVLLSFRFIPNPSWSDFMIRLAKVYYQNDDSPL
jgi:hypothetical protein